MRIAVAGNDIAGLTLALRLAIKGHAVTVHESATPSSLDEAFTVIAPYRDLFLKSGAALDDVIGLSPVTTPMTFEGIELPPSGAQAPTIADALGEATGREWAVFLQSGAHLWSQVRRETLTPKRSLAQELRRTLRTPTLRRLAVAYLPVPDGHKLSDAAVVFPYLVQTFGTWTFDGGLTTFERLLRGRCADRAVRFSSEPAPPGALAVDEHFSAMFSAPTRWLHRPRAVPTRSLGLPFIGMAAESMAERIGRA